MSLQRGRNAGVTGAVDISGSPKFTARVYRFSQALGVQSQSRSGPGTGRWAKTRALLPNGSLALTGKVVLTGFPMPTDWRGQEGTIVLQQHTGVIATVSVRVTACKISLDEKSEDQWDISLTCEILGVPVLSGFTGSQPAPTDPTPTTQETWEGRQKVYDPDGIITAATQRYSIDWFNWAETDDAEKQKLLDIIAAATTPLPNLKVHHASIDRTDRDGAIATISWDLTTSAEAIINANTRKTIDPSGLNSSATVAGINVPAAAPTGDAFVLTASLSYELNDQNILYVDSYGLRTSHQAIEQDGGGSADDPQDLADEAQVALEGTATVAPATPTSPVSGLKLSLIRKKQLNNGHYVYTYFFGRTDNLDEIQLGGTSSDYDPNLLAGSAIITLVNSSSTPPTTPAAPIDGVKFVGRTVRQRHDTRWIHVFKYEPLDSKDRLTIPQTSAIATATTGVSNVLPEIVFGSSAYDDVVSVFNANKANVFFRNARSVRLPNGMIYREVEWEDAPIIVRFQSGNRVYRTLTARISGGVAQVFLIHRVQMTSTIWWYMLGYGEVSSVEIAFGVSRKWSSSVLPMHTELASTVNSGAFLGLPAGTASYQGAGGETNIAIPGPRISAMEWNFVYYSDGGFAETENLPVGQYIPITADLSALAPGTWVAASALNLSSVVQLPGGDYSVFTS